ncbi:LLM class flavin-dependent oxidoreductase [Sphingobium lignivorans]|uniref:Alkanesulfonate monooxygenase SsuD/methylene tetrahydromethanopterin reductase-like flavin-dependent oxidoreductase (Luciferase family) n=1 Tax=Sphingobium lignivorans TaxID=2735886 RepID=A0ABR6NK91_9SPHN|nr:LLM class flavin-dependent oxidoreductase [Sphingobium lignivorans]MBB5987706.1 alkanesulfonate monooxygenase SsuD/methylene tetrahydromethanopterin reductase-like flavin-dependent oxidoreductase (luciferase family) [Sphingobium lignivorans]
MHIGLASGFAHQRGRDYPDQQFVQEEVENLVLAEELGFDSVWITEHHFSDYSMSNDPLQLLTYIAGRTKRVKLGTQVIIVPWHDPVRLAEKIINLDILSRGRALLGFGNGLAPHEFEGLRVDQTKSRELYREILDLVIPAIETGIIEGKGKHIDQPRRELRPAPLRSFEGRKFCGSLSGTSMHTAARLGFGNMVLMLPQRGKEAPPDMYAEIWAQERPGTLPPPPMVSGNYYIDESADYAEVQGRHYLANTMRAAIRNYSLDKPGTFATMKGYESYEKMTLQPDEIEPYVENFSRSVVTGTPQMILDRMWELKEIYEPQGFFPHVHFGGMPQEEARKNILLFAQKVLPEVKSWTAQASIDDRFMAAAE